MKPRRASFLLAAAFVPAGCAQEQPGPVPDAAPLRATPQDATEFIRFERRTLEFRPSRDDFTVASAVFSIHCSNPGEVRINGATPDSSWRYIDLVRVGKNRFELPPLEIEIPREHTGLVCMSVKVWFHEVPNEYDSLFYEETDDRYALVSYCTSAEGPDWEQARPRFQQNRVESLEAFRETLSKPFEIRLNQRPLSFLEQLRR
jgi:hypothetical protein